MACLTPALLAALPLRAAPPPLLPDWETAQLYEGCAVQADSYARRLKALDPTWEVSLATFKLANGAMHSVAIARKNDETYIRDSVLGVFPAGDQLQTTFARRLRKWRQDHPYTTPNASNNYLAPETEAATKATVEIVQRSLQTESQRYLVVDGTKRFWVIAWTTIDGKRALYHPGIGTTLTPTRGTQDAIALAILHMLGCKQPTLIGSSQR